MFRPRNVLIGAAVVGVLLLGVSYLQRRAVNPRAGLLDPINPLSRDNIAYTGANAAGAVLTDDPDFTVGAWLWELTHPTAVELERRQFSGAATTAPAAPDAAAARLDEMSPFAVGA